MKKQYISPNCLVVRLHTTGSILNVSGGLTGTLNIDNTDDVITNSSDVWSKESTSVWDEEW